MSLTLRVTVEVVDTATGELVNTSGNTVHKLSPFPPLRALVNLREYAHASNAHTAMNKVHALAKDLREIMQ